jgi:nucleotide-binding universal stress UspA family protein
MITEILCTTDFSDSSNVALKWSINLARKLGAHLTILYTYRLFKQNGEAVMMKRIIEQEAAKNFGALENELLSESGIEYDFKTEVGFVADRIGAHAKKKNISFLVMAKTMSMANREVFDDLVAQLRVPLVIVP